LGRVISETEQLHRCGPNGAPELHVSPNMIRQIGFKDYFRVAVSGVPLLAEAAFAGGTERSGQNCAERVGLSAQLAVQL
jgi:hypothetical protein